MACLMIDLEIGEGFLGSEDEDLLGVRSLMMTMAGAVRHRWSGRGLLK